MSAWQWINKSTWQKQCAGNQCRSGDTSSVLQLREIVLVRLRQRLAILVWSYVLGEKNGTHYISGYVASTNIKGRKVMFYLTTHSTHFIYGYVASTNIKGRKEMEMFYLTTHSTHFISGYVASTNIKGRKEMFYLTTHSTHFISGYVASTNIKGRKEMFYLTTHSTHFISGYVASTNIKGRKEMFYLTTHSTHFYMVIWRRTHGKGSTRCSQYLGYTFQLARRVLLCALSNRHDSTYHGLCYTSRGAFVGMRNSSMGPPSGIDPTTHRT